MSTVYIELQSNGTTVGAEALENPVYIKYQDKNKMLLRCNQKEAQGIMSADNNTIYQLKDKPELKGVEENILNAFFISKEDYENIKVTLPDIDEEETEEHSPDEEQQETNTMNTAQMRAEIIKLTESVKTLQEQNQMLTDCILEISENIYA